MGSPSYMWSVVDRNVVMRCIPVLDFEAPQLVMCVVLTFYADLPEQKILFGFMLKQTHNPMLMNWHVMLLLQYIVWQGVSSCSRVIDGTMEAAAWVERTAKYCHLEINC